jgi:hypothetical protein
MNWLVRRVFVPQCCDSRRSTGKKTQVTRHHLAFR